MKPIRWISITLLCLVGWVSAHAAGPADKAGMVVDVQGTARLVSGGASKKLELLAYVAPGARIEVDAGGRASVSVYAARSVYQVRGPAVVEVKADGLSAISGNAPESKSLAQKLVASSKPRDRVHGAVRMRDAVAGIALVTPENGAVLVEGPPKFHWEATAPGPYMLKLVDLGAPDALMAEASVAQTSWAVPGDAAFAPGHAYRWSVASADGSTASGEFSVAAADVVALLTSIRPAADAPVEEWVLYATALQEHGLRDEARDAWKRIAEQRPDLTKARFLAR